MRIWSLHPRFLDQKGLVACWRETLLAQAVLAGRTRGYTNHPQLERFRELDDPIAAIGAYLTGIAAEADARGYHFDRTRIDRPGTADGLIPATQGQLDYEWAHLRTKLAQRDPDWRARWADGTPTSHPLFRVVPGELESWERPPTPPGGPGRTAL